MTTANQTSTLDALETAITQAVAQQQAELASAVAETAALRRKEEEAAIAAFKLPFDEATIALLPGLRHHFEGEAENSVLVSSFVYKDMHINLKQSNRSNHSSTWTITATRSDIYIKGCKLNVYPHDNWYGYFSATELGQQFLVFLHEAATLPTPERKEAEAQPLLKVGALILQEHVQKRRERYIRAALTGTVTQPHDLTPEAAATFAIATADAVIEQLQQESGAAENTAMEAAD